jgi:hypothetical protein
MRSAIYVFPFLLALASAPASSENWRKSGSTGGAIGYIDTDSLKRDGDKIRFWTEVRLPEPQSAPSGERFDRMAALVEIDCRAKTYRNLKSRANLGDRLIHQGKVPKGAPDPVRPGTNIHVQLRAVCFDDWQGGR